MDSHCISDQMAREEALNPENSYIIQAPAGSGKTELLTQRYLMLLSQAQQVPEEIIAITFTRKAAAEMQMRILQALQKAHKETKPIQAHAQKTWELAHKVLQKDNENQWNLLNTPNRLQIFTIDSFCANLARQMPLLSQLGSTIKITDDPLLLYEKATRKLLSSIEYNTPWEKALENLLLHLDNDYTKIEHLLIGMLAKRDQWLPYLGVSQNNRSSFEKALQNILLENIEKIIHHLPLNLINELLTLVQFSGQNCANHSLNSRHNLCVNLTELPTMTLEDSPKWLTIAQLLLTQKKQWRKKVTQQEGFPSPSNTKDKAEKSLFTDMKRRMEVFIETCSEHEALRQSLQNLIESPPIHYTDNQWEIIDTFLILLPVLAAHLRIEFQLVGEVDYIEIAQSALTALGESDSPTDLALTLDYRIQHILIDEFQDTSAQQFRLIEQLTAGWEPGDGRTLFLVGDPMQSIYRFRKAEVGLFLRAKEYGIGHIKLTSLTLTSNFRSQATLVDWFNTTFENLLPKVEDIATGAVSYTPCHAIQNNEASSVNIYPFYTKDYQPEAQKIIQIIQTTLATQPQASIAILVRAKSHLSIIISTLQEAHIPYKAIDIDPLLHRQAIQDLLALTQALLRFNDRTTWLALLRTPWCGLTLTELHLIVSSDHHASIWDQLQSYESLPLNNESKQRIKQFIHILNETLVYRGRFSLRFWIESTWIKLGGPACLLNKNDLLDVQTFFETLEKVDIGGTIANFSQLYNHLNKLYESPNNQQGNAVEIMSIHKSKGLEFDTVIIPSLGREIPYDDPQLLLWMERPKQHGGWDLLAAPIRAAHEEYDPVYRYLRDEENNKNVYEMGRLLYVAVTRAKKHLHLLGHCSVENPPKKDAFLKPAKNSLLAQLWPQIDSHFQLQIIENHNKLNDENTIIEKKANLRRLKSHWQLPIPNTSFLMTQKPHWIKNSAHELPLPYPDVQLHKILSPYVPLIYQKKEISLNFVRYLKNSLKQQQVSEHDIEFCLQIVKTITEKIKDDGQAKWLFMQHQFNQANLCFDFIENQQCIQFTIDWYFIDEQQQQWFILYDFLPCNESEKASFIQHALQRYQSTFEKINQLPLLEQAKQTRKGIYFPLFNEWIEVK
ncbi:MAG: ATP-dependent helicase/nuclease subunit A [Legionellaceae bacterium]